MNALLKQNSPLGKKVIAARSRRRQHALTPRTRRRNYLFSRQRTSVCLVHTDHQGTPRLATNAAGVKVWSHEGRVFGDTPPNEDPDGNGINTVINLRHSRGYFHAESGLIRIGERDYDPKLGRWITADRMSVAQHFKRWRGRLGRGGEATPESNPYAFGRNNPLRYTDPTGKVAIADDVIIIGGAVIVTGCLASPGCRDALSAGAKACGQLIDQTITGLGNLIFNEGDKDASTPTGRRGNPIEVEPGTNEPTNIGGRDYTGHALDRMQGRGVPPSAVEDAIQNGNPSSGNQPGTTVHTGSNGVTVVVGSGGQVITVITK